MEFSPQCGRHSDEQKEHPDIMPCSITICIKENMLLAYLNLVAGENEYLSMPNYNNLEMLRLGV